MNSTLNTQDTMDISTDNTVRPFNLVGVGAGMARAGGTQDEFAARVSATRVNKKSKKGIRRRGEVVPVGVIYDEDGTHTIVVPPDTTPAQKGRLMTLGNQIAARNAVIIRMRERLLAKQNGGV